MDRPAALQAPEWHGHNLDALADSIRGGDLNRVNPPFAVRIVGTPASPEAAREMARLATLFGELSAEGVQITWSNSSYDAHAT